jgi:hypothetical protein
MTDLTDEQLDKARDAEVLRIVSERWRTKHGAEALETAVMEVLDERRRLDASGWQPAPPVDPVLLAVREIVAGVVAKRPFGSVFGDEVRRGERDYSEPVSSALAAYRAAQSATEARLMPVVEAGKAVRASLYANHREVAATVLRQNAADRFDAALSALERSAALKTMEVGE